MVQRTGGSRSKARPPRSFSQMELETAKLGLQIYALAQLLGEQLNIPEIREIAVQVRLSQGERWEALANLEAGGVVTPDVSPGVTPPPDVPPAAALPAVKWPAIFDTLPALEEGEPRPADKVDWAGLLANHPSFKLPSPGG